MSTSTPVKFSLKELKQICINCSSSCKEKRRVVNGDTLEMILRAHKLDLVEEMQNLFVCNDCFTIVRQFSRAKEKIQSSINGLLLRGNNGPIRHLRGKRARTSPKIATPTKLANSEVNRTPKKRKKELFPSTPKKQTPTKTCRVVVSISLCLAVI